MNTFIILRFIFKHIGGKCRTMIMIFSCCLNVTAPIFLFKLSLMFVFDEVTMTKVFVGYPSLCARSYHVNQCIF